MTSMANAELAFVGGRIFTGRGRPAEPGAVAVSGGTISAVGTDDDVRAWIGPKTEVIELGDRLLAPGFQDAHIHPVYGGTQMSQCDLHSVITADDSVAVVAQYAAAHPEASWILGGGWSMGAFPGGT